MAKTATKQTKKSNPCHCADTKTKTTTKSRAAKETDCKDCK